MLKDIFDFILQLGQLPHSLEISAFILVAMITAGVLGMVYFWGRFVIAQGQYFKSVLKQNERLTERGITASETLATSLGQLGFSIQTAFGDLKGALETQARVDRANTRAIIGYIESSLGTHTQQANTRYDAIIKSVGELRGLMLGIIDGRAILLAQINTLGVRLNRVEHVLLGDPIEVLPPVILEPPAATINFISSLEG